MWKDGKWARQILDLQQPDGLWGYFHTLSEPSRNPLTTEQALRRLRVLGFTIEDPPILQAIAGLDDYLLGRRAMPDRVEKTPDWPVYQQLMPAVWIRLFTKESAPANRVAEQWARIITAAFANGSCDQQAYFNAYKEQFGRFPTHDRCRDFCNFYPVALLRDCLAPGIAEAFFRHVLHHPAGLYYMTSRPLTALPAFDTKEASRHLGALELMAEYVHPACRRQLAFAADWLLGHRDENGEWDMGASARDGVYLPLSDSWRTPEQRRQDCTARIRAFLSKVTV